MSFYISDYRHNFLEEAAPKNLESIVSIIKREAKKHGKKSREYQLIVAMQNDYSDIAIYTALALARTTEGGGWSIDDILGELEDKPLIDKKYHQYLVKDGDKGMNDKEKKQKAMEIWKDVVEQEKRQVSAMGSFLSKFKKPEEEERDPIEEIVDQLVNDVANQLEDLSKQDPERAFEEIEKASREVISDNHEIVDFLTQDMEFEEDEDKEDSAVTEFGSMVAKNLRVRSAHAGRRKSAWSK